jgi:hypothetical protein
MTQAPNPPSAAIHPVALLSHSSYTAIGDGLHDRNRIEASTTMLRFIKTAHHLVSFNHHSQHLHHQSLPAGSYAMPMPVAQAVPDTSAMAKRTSGWTNFEDFSKSFLEAFFKRDLESDATQIWDDVKPEAENLANKVETWIDSRDLSSDANQVWDDVKTDADKVKNKVEAWVDSRDLSSGAHQV